MNVFFKRIVNDKVIRYGNAASAVLLVTEVIYTLFVYRYLPPFLPLFNQMPWGEMRIGESR